MNTKEVKTAEQILRDALERQGYNYDVVKEQYKVWNKAATEAMEEYASQFKREPVDVEGLAEAELEKLADSFSRMEYSDATFSFNKSKQFFKAGFKAALSNQPLRAEENYWKKRCELAEDILKHTPCDPDITATQRTANAMYKEFVDNTPAPSTLSEGNKEEVKDDVDDLENDIAEHILDLNIKLNTLQSQLTLSREWIKKVLDLFTRMAAPSSYRQEIHNLISSAPFYEEVKQLPIKHGEVDYWSDLDEAREWNERLAKQLEEEKRWNEMMINSFESGHHWNSQDFINGYRNKVAITTATLLNDYNQYKQELK